MDRQTLVSEPTVQGTRYCTVLFVPGTSSLVVKNVKNVPNKIMTVGGHFHVSVL